MIGAALPAIIIHRLTAQTVISGVSIDLGFTVIDMEQQGAPASYHLSFFASSSLAFLSFLVYSSPMDDNISITGKKIFFLYPQTIVQNEILTELVMQEYEAYTVKDPQALRRVLKRYPDSIVFVNIDEKLPEKEWELWILGVMKDTATSKVGVGVLTASSDVNLARRYLEQIKITCGFIHISADFRKLLYQIMEVLKAQDAMGRRKYIRAITDNEAATKVNIPLGDKFVSGTIRDISAAGFSCAFPEDPCIEKNTLITNMQLKLQSSLLRAEGIVLGSRMEELMRIYVVVFTPKTDPDVRTRIRLYIQGNIQARMDMEMKK
jgi:hypothetical protein